ncbi:hypothetical protein QYE76_026172 [Lolium multiflorum]|uniref:CCHC-type domain-containing protein n=1 Tax=Lolium multiflorum TaxID=4521 RepID=A0AAD8RFR4_LOLMU|nr:hypothetical protein QYE76_026172 [Lolium multiflorum]
MGKPRDTKIAILPSTTRKGTTLSTSAALDSPSVISKLVSPPQASNAGTSAESENSSYNCDDASAVLDNDGSLGSFLDATIARSRQIENTETPNENAATPVNSPESVEYSSDDLDEDYVELDDDFIEKCNATTDARKIKKLLAEHAVRYKLSPDPKFATSPINIKDKDYDFSLDLSHIAIVEKTPFCGTEKESAVEHMIELSTLSSLFSDDVKMRTYFVAKFFPFSLKDDAKTWYNNLPPGSIRSPIDLRDVFFRKYFPASAQHIALQRIYNFDQEDGEKLPEAWARFCSLIRAQPDHDLEKHDLLDIFYSGLTIESRAYLDSCAGCVFRKRTPDDAEELLAKIGRNHDDWSTPEPTPTPILKKRGMIKLNDEDMREAKKSLKEKGIKPEDVKNLPPIEDLCKITPPSSMIEDPLYPEGHPKRVEQDSQLTKTSAPSKKKKKKHKNVVESSEPVNDPNSISISDAETESGNEHDKDNDKDDTPDKEEVEEEPEKHALCYMKDIVSNKRKIPNEEISTMLANYSFNGKVPKKLGDPAIRVPQWGSCEKVRGTPRELSNLYTMICNGRSFSDDGGKISSIQQPAIRYFAYFVTKYEEGASIARGREEQLDMELDMKISHGRAREEREACAKEEEVQAGAQPGLRAVALATGIDRETSSASYKLSPPPHRVISVVFIVCSSPPPSLTEKIGPPLIILVSDFSVSSEISQKLDTTNETVTKMQDQMTDIQRSLQVLALAVYNLTQQQQQEDEDPKLQDEARGVGRGVGRGNRGRGFVELGARRVPPQPQDDGLGKPKFSIPKFEGGADVEEYLTWELKIEKLWRLHDYTEDRKVKLASSEFDGYALRWWDGVTRARQEDNELPVLTWREMKAIMQARFVPTNYLRSIFDKLTLLRQGVKTVDTYFMEMEMLMQRGRVRESLEMTMQRFLHGLKYDIKGIVRHHSYTTMNELLHHAREAEAHLAEEAQIKGRATGAGRYTPRAPPSTAPAPSSRSAPFPTSSSKPVSNVYNTKKSEPAASTSGSSMSTARNRDMNCHTCGGKGHFKRDCPNRKVMFVNDNDEYETGDDADPYAPEDDDYDSDGVDAFPSEARTIVVSQRALNVQPSASTQRCNLFQTKALVGPDKACKVIIDGGSCRNLASKELCAKLKLKYLPHPHPYYIQWLSDNGEMKVNHMVRVDFEIGPYKDSIDFDVVPMTVCHLLLGRPWLYDRSVQHNGRANTYHLEFKGKKINLQPMSPQQIVNESRQKLKYTWRMHL